MTRLPGLRWAPECDDGTPVRGVLVSTLGHAGASTLLCSRAGPDSPTRVRPVARGAMLPPGRIIPDVRPVGDDGRARHGRGAKRPHTSRLAGAKRTSWSASELNSPSSRASLSDTQVSPRCFPPRSNTARTGRSSTSCSDRHDGNFVFVGSSVVAGGPWPQRWIALGPDFFLPRAVGHLGLTRAPGGPP